MQVRFDFKYTNVINLASSNWGIQLSVEGGKVIGFEFLKGDDGGGGIYAPMHIISAAVYTGPTGLVSVVDEQRALFCVLASFAGRFGELDASLITVVENCPAPAGWQRRAIRKKEKTPMGWKVTTLDSVRLESGWKLIDRDFQMAGLTVKALR